MINGLDIFKEAFKNFTDNYIIIGGVACYLQMNNVGLDFRMTKDIDMIIMIDKLSSEFGKQVWKFIKDGGYEEYQRDGQTKFIDFLNLKISDILI